MFGIFYSTQFKKDFKRIENDKRKVKKLESALEILIREGNLKAKKFKTHLLKGEYEGDFEAHITPDFLLIWYVVDNIVYLSRTGSHSELFK